MRHAHTIPTVNVNMRNEWNGLNGHNRPEPNKKQHRGTDHVTPQVSAPHINILIIIHERLLCMQLRKGSLTQSSTVT